MFQSPEPLRTAIIRSIRRLTPSEGARLSRNSIPALPLSTTRPVDDDEDRSVCLDCHGKGCPACAHSGRVCPVCRGARFLRREWSQFTPNTAIVADDRCKACCEGNQVNPTKEDALIVRYLAWRAAHLAERHAQ